MIAFIHTTSLCTCRTGLVFPADFKFLALHMFDRERGPSRAERRPGYWSAAYRLAALLTLNRSFPKQRQQYKGEQGRF